MAAQDLTAKKRAFMYRYMNAVIGLMNARATLQGIAKEWVDNGYAGAIVQNDIQDPGLIHLTPTILANGINAQAQLENLMENAAVTTGAYGTTLGAIVGT